MPDYLSMVERGLKAVRYGAFKASDRLADVLDGLCRAPEDSAAGSPQNAAVVAPSPKQGSDSGPADSDIPPVARWAAPTPPSPYLPSIPQLLFDGANAIDLWLEGRPVDYGYTRSQWQLSAVYMRQLAEDLEAQK